jgi:ATP-dependent Clp protease protease subunit
MPAEVMPGPAPDGPEGPAPSGAPEWVSRIEADVERKTIRLMGPVNEQMAHGFRKILGELDTLSRTAVHMPHLVSKLPEGWGEKPITVEIDSPGGDLYAGLLMYSEMRRVPTKIKTVALRHASSAALVLLVGGDERETYPHILAVDHQLSSGFSGNLREILAFADHVRDLQAEVNEIFDKTTHGKLPQKVKDDVVIGDVYLDAKKLLEYGFVDRIVEVNDIGGKPAVPPAPEGMPAMPRTADPRARGGLTVVPGGRPGTVPPGFPGGGPDDIAIPEVGLGAA